MKQVTSILKMFFFALLLIGGTACTSNFADINRKDYEVDKNELLSLIHISEPTRPY